MEDGKRVSSEDKGLFIQLKGFPQSLSLKNGKINKSSDPRTLIEKRLNAPVVIYQDLPVNTEVSCL